MTYEERNTFVAILTNLLVTGYLAFRVYDMYGAGAFDGADGLTVWAQTVLWIIPVSIVATIVLTILFNIGYAIVTQNANPGFVRDERDKLIGRQGMIVTMFVVSAGFIMAIGSLALGFSALFAFNLTLFAFAGGDLVGSLARIYLSRRGA